MSADPLILDPEFEALLREVAADPNSTLLRVARPKVVRGFFEREDAASASETGLSAAERHLVQAHRNELAWLLRQAAFSKLLDGPVSKLCVSRHGPRGEDRSPSSQADLSARWRDGRSEPMDEPSTVAVRLLDRLLMPQGGSSTVAELAAASHRLEPSNAARLLIATDMCCSGLPQTGLRLARFVLASHPSVEHSTRALECVGFAFGKLDRLRDAHRAYQKGSRAADSHTEMNRLVFAIQVGDRADALDCGRHLDGLLSKDAACVASFVETRLRRRAEGEWSPTSAGCRLAAELLETLDGVARRVVNVLV
jgi:hypothetical protein